MRIVVVGGSGRIGSRLVALLARAGHEVVAASRRTGVDAVTGEGLADALRGASVVVDVSDSPSLEDGSVTEFFKAETRNLLTAEAAAAVGHHVMLSVVGTGRLLHSGYFRAKRAQERLIRDSSARYSIVQATQFFEFLEGIADAATHGNAVRVPPVLIQPIAADDVARALAGIATSTPLQGTVEIGGPEPFHLDGLIQRFLGARHDPRKVIPDRMRATLAPTWRSARWLPVTKRNSARSGSTTGSNEPHRRSEKRTARTNSGSAKSRRDRSCSWAMSPCSTSKEASVRRRPCVRTGKVRSLWAWSTARR